MKSVLDILNSEDSPAADHALLAALPGAETPKAQTIVESLLARNQKPGLRGLVVAFHEFNDSIQRLLIGDMDKLFGVLREVSQSRGEQARVNVLELIRRGCAYRAAYLADVALHDRSARVREAAAETIHALADQLLRTSAIPEEDLAELVPEEIRLRMADLEAHVEDRRQVVSAIESGLQSFNLHLHPAVVEAAMWFVDDLGARFWSIVSVPGSRPAHAAIGAIGGFNNPRLVPFCITALSYGEFRPHVARGLATCTDPAFLSEWLRESWRIAQPKTARSMAALKDFEFLKDRAAELLQCTGAQIRHLPGWISATGVSAVQKSALLKDLYRRGERSVRRAAAAAAVGWQHDEGTALLRRIAQDSGSEDSRIALYELARRRPLEYPLDSLTSTPDAGPGLTAERRAAATLTFDRYWAAFDRLAEKDRRSLGEQLMAKDHSARAKLSRRLAESEPAGRIRALHIITLLGISEQFTEQLYQLSRDDHPEVRGTAVKALGQVPGVTSKRILRDALSDQDSRVQANAVEGVEASGDKSAADDLLPKLTSKDNRVRANAVKALLKLGVREAAETLLRMLDDANRAQRISALWLIDRMGLFSLAKRVVAVARGDSDPQVRERAGSLADQLTRGGPTDGASPPARKEVASSAG